MCRYYEAFKCVYFIAVDIFSRIEFRRTSFDIGSIGSQRSFLQYVKISLPLPKDVYRFVYSDIIASLGKCLADYVADRSNLVLCILRRVLSIYL